MLSEALFDAAGIAVTFRCVYAVEHDPNSHELMLHMHQPDIPQYIFGMQPSWWGLQHDQLWVSVHSLSDYGVRILVVFAFLAIAFHAFALCL